jgi:periplasmic protein TonB
MKLLLTVTVITFLSALTCPTHSCAQSGVKDDRTYTKVEVEASYPGGDTAWIHFLNHTLRYPDDAVDNQIQGKVIVQFIVHTDSTISDVLAIGGPSKGGLREEAVSVVKASGKWVPATQDGRSVNSYRKTPIQFKLVVTH